MSSEFNSQTEVQLQTQTQTQTIAPRQVLEARLLSLSAVELEERVRDELLDNPALEEAGAYGADSDAPQSDPWDDEPGSDGRSEADDRSADYLSEDDIPDYYRDPLAVRSADSEAAEIPLSDTVSFYDTLVQQLGEHELSAQDRQTAEYIIGSLDDNGFLPKSNEELSTEIAINLFLDVDVDTIRRIVDVIQSFDPAGIAAHDLQECLLLQLRRKAVSPVRDLAVRIVGECLDEFRNMRRDKIAARLEADDGDVIAALELISHLNPRPGSALGESEHQGSNHIVPDFTIESYDGTIQFTLNNFNVPELNVSRSFSDTLSARLDSGNADVRQAAAFIRHKIDSAQGFINALRQREITLTRTMQTIIDLQPEYFLSGDESTLHPMILKDIADRTGFDISTISRATANKYAETEFGIICLKDLFTGGINGSDGIEVSVREIHRIIREAVDAEDRSAPLTDDAIAGILKKQGYDVARRTVAKYRDTLGIPVSRLRR